MFFLPLLFCVAHFAAVKATVTIKIQGEGGGVASCDIKKIAKITPKYIKDNLPSNCKDKHLEAVKFCKDGKALGDDDEVKVASGYFYGSYPILSARPVTVELEGGTKEVVYVCEKETYNDMLGRLPTKSKGQAQHQLIVEGVRDLGSIIDPQKDSFKAFPRDKIDFKIISPWHDDTKVHHEKRDVDSLRKQVVKSGLSKSPKLDHQHVAICEDFDKCGGEVLEIVQRYVIVGDHEGFKYVTICANETYEQLTKRLYPDSTVKVHGGVAGEIGDEYIVGKEDDVKTKPKILFVRMRDDQPIDMAYDVSYEGYNKDNYYHIYRFMGVVPQQPESAPLTADLLSELMRKQYAMFDLGDEASHAPLCKENESEWAADDSLADLSELKSKSTAYARVYMDRAWKDMILIHVCPKSSIGHAIRQIKKVRGIAQDAPQDLQFDTSSVRGRHNYVIPQEQSAEWTGWRHQLTRKHNPCMYCEVIGRAPEIESHHTVDGSSGQGDTVQDHSEGPQAAHPATLPLTSTGEQSEKADPVSEAKGHGPEGIPDDKSKHEEHNVVKEEKVDASHSNMGQVGSDPSLGGIDQPAVSDAEQVVKGQHEASQPDQTVESEGQTLPSPDTDHVERSAEPALKHEPTPGVPSHLEHTAAPTPEIPPKDTQHRADESAIASNRGGEVVPNRESEHVAEEGEQKKPLVPETMSSEDAQHLADETTIASDRVEAESPKTPEPIVETKAQKPLVPVAALSGQSKDAEKSENALEVKEQTTQSPTAPDKQLAKPVQQPESKDPKVDQKHVYSGLRAITKTIETQKGFFKLPILNWLFPKPTETKTKASQRAITEGAEGRKMEDASTATSADTPKQTIPDSSAEGEQNALDYEAKVESDVLPDLKPPTSDAPPVQGNDPKDEQVHHPPSSPSELTTGEQPIVERDVKVDTKKQVPVKEEQSVPAQKVSRSGGSRQFIPKLETIVEHDTKEQDPVKEQTTPPFQSIHASNVEANSKHVNPPTNAQTLLPPSTKEPFWGRLAKIIKSDMSYLVAIGTCLLVLVVASVAYSSQHETNAMDSLV